MGFAKIGYCGSGGTIDEYVQWKRRACELAIPYLRTVVGPEPPDTRLKLYVCCETVLSIGFEWWSVDGEPTEYMRKCRLAVQTFDETVDWQKLHPDNFAAEFEEIENVVALAEMEEEQDVE